MRIAICLFFLTWLSNPAFAMGTKLFQWANPQKDQETIDAEKLIEEQRKKQDAAKDEPIDNPNAERTTPAK